MSKQQQTAIEAPAPPETYHLAIEGMSCGHCVASVEKAVSALPGVASVSVSLESSRAEVTGGLPHAAIEAIREAGYQASPIAEIPENCPLPEPVGLEETGSTTQSLDGGYLLAVDDMSCASCVSAVERAIRSVDGVEAAAVNLVEKRAQVVGGDSQAVVNAVIDQGYGAHLIEAQQPGGRLQLQIEYPAVDEQATILQRVLTDLDPKAEYSRVDEYWEVETRLHPADLLLGLEAAGCRASLGEGFSDPYAEEAAVAAAEIRRSWQRALMAGLIGAGLMIIEMGGYAPALSAPGGQSFWLAVAMITLVVMRFSGSNYYRGAWKQARHLSANMDSLVALGTGAAWLSSLAIVLMPDGSLLRGEKLYFDASVLILAFLQFGHVLETRAKRTTSEAVGSLVGLAPKIARVVRQGKEVEVPVSLLRIGDHIRVRPGERIAIDGEVVEGRASIDESMLTGESMPAEKRSGDPVTGGTINRSGTLLFQVTRLGEETTLAHIIDMVRQAQMSKPPIGRLVDKISSVFVPIVILISLLTFGIWHLIGPEPQMSFALTAAIAVLVIACPCALGLATPIAIMVGTSRAAQLNVLIRNSEGLQSASRLTHLVVDKTGTLTLGRPKVTAIHPVDGADERSLVHFAASVESVSAHPLAEAILDRASGMDLEPIGVTDFQSHDGQGVEGTVDGRQVQLGGRQYLKTLGIEPPSPLVRQAEAAAAEAGTPVWLILDGEVKGLFVLKDPLRTDSRQAVSALSEQGVKVVMCTGDNRATGAAVARQLGIEEVYSELLPWEKLEIVKTLQRQGHRVGMVGDGVNDAPALAQADTGFAIGSGADVAIHNADITLAGDSLSHVGTAIALSSATLRNIKQNLFGAFIYNVIGIPLAAGVLYPLTGWLLPPMFASAAMAMSSVTVVTNANRLRFFKPLQ
ncbi:MAG: heavy metal translocating P-type ATPase [Candidatus Thiodiazotropha sp. (ex Monitilora ramsayi)]|nr:heavy metal translocating P-type ATPase [Candidatus Thiodiazotropha sp. (ex Monitilora ramsayi)]